MPAKPQKYTPALWLMVLLILLTFQSRLLMLDHITFAGDEIRSIFRTYGTPIQVMNWQPHNWSPFFNLYLAGWRALMGDLPHALRLSTIFIFLPAVAIAYRTARYISRTADAGLLTAAAYAALGYGAYLSTYLRGYAFLLLLFPLTIYTLERFCHRQNAVRGIILGVTGGLLFLSTYTTAIAAALIAPYAIWRLRRRVWRLVLPVAVALVVVAPDLYRNRTGFASTDDGFQTLFYLRPPLLNAYADMFYQYAGKLPWVWFGIVLVAITLLAVRRASVTIWWGVAAFAVTPILMHYLTAYNVVFAYFGRYAAWGIFLMAWVVGAGLGAARSRPFTGVALIALVVLAFLPMSRNLRFTDPVHEEVLRHLYENARPGDAFIVDPSICTVNCSANGEPGLQFAYYQRTYAAAADLQSTPDGARRVWYLHINNSEAYERRRAVEDSGYLLASFFGPPEYLLFEYVAPPDPVGIRFENGLRFHGMEVLRDGEPLAQPLNIWSQHQLTLRLWWSVDAPLAEEVSTAVKFTLPNGAEPFGVDGPPQPVRFNPTRTSPPPQSMTAWEPGNIYVDEREIVVPQIGGQQLDIYLTVYQWWDGVRLTAPGTDENDLLWLSSASLWDW
jgi:hypothetical protein